MNLIEPIHQHAKARPNSLAIVTPQIKLTWSQLDGLVWSTALKLSENGLQVGDKVGVTMANPMVHLVVSLAVARMGVAHIAIPASDSDLVRDALVNKLGLKTIICDTEKVAGFAANHILVNKLDMFDIGQHRKDQLASTNGDLTWLILQSSGTTGLPKFSELSHLDALKRLDHFLDLLSIMPSDVVWVPSRQDFLMSKYALIGSLRGGATACLPFGMTLSQELVKFLNVSNVTIARAIPSFAAQLAELGIPIPSLRFFGVTSAPVSEELKTEFKKKVNPNLFVIYATNEVGAISMASPNEASHAVGSVGKPSSAIEIEIVDVNHAVQPAGQPGEIRVRAPGAIQSYLNAPEANAASFKDGWFYPGDLGLINAENELIFLGRKDDMMIFDGMNIYPLEIEVVLNAHPCVLEAAAFPLKHVRFHQMPVAAVKLREAVAEENLLSYCKEQLGIKYPKIIFIVDDFPRNPMGKILKRELALNFHRTLQQ